MFCLSKKVDYALTALAYLAEQTDRVASAREIAQTFDLPAALLMNILKELQHCELLKSTRGVKGGYKIAADLSKISLFDLIRFTECDDDEPIHRVSDCGCAGNYSYELELAQTSSQGPVQALHFKLIRFLKDVKLSDLVLPGRRIDVPLEGLANNKPKRVEVAAGVVGGVIAGEKSL